MNKTTKIVIFSIILISLILLLIFVRSFNPSGFTTSEETYNYNYSWTKAICNETHCQDYQIYCNEDKLIKQAPITGAIIEIPDSWIDPRNETNRNRICE